MILPKPGWIPVAETGTLVRKALNIFPKTQFYLVDPSSAMLDQAFIKIPDERAIFLGQTCTEDLDEITDLNFDVITAVQCHHYLEKDDRIWAVRTCFRHLNKRGIFITSENIRPMTIEGTGLALRYWKDRQEQNGRTSDDVEKHLKRFDTEFFPLTIPEHLKLYTDTGFQVVEILWVSYMQAAFYCIKL